MPENLKKNLCYDERNNPNFAFLRVKHEHMCGKRSSIDQILPLLTFICLNHGSSKACRVFKQPWIVEATPSFFCSTIKDGCYLVIKMWVLKSKPRIPQAHHHSSRQYKEALEPACVFAVFCRIHEWGKGGNDDCLSIFVPISLSLLLHRKSIW